MNEYELSWLDAARAPDRVRVSFSLTGVADPDRVVAAMAQGMVDEGFAKVLLEKIDTVRIKLVTS